MTQSSHEQTHLGAPGMQHGTECHCGSTSKGSSMRFGASRSNGEAFDLGNAATPAVVAATPLGSHECDANGPPPASANGRNGTPEFSPE